MPLPRLLILALACVMSACAAQAARAQEAPSAHAWVTVPAESDGSILLHIPPRTPQLQAMPAPDLRVARVARLSSTPEWLVPVGSTVYCIMPADERGLHRVGRSRAFARGLRDLWGADPSRRLGVLPAIEGDVLAVCSDGEAPLALDRAGGELRVLRLEAAGWSAVTPALEAEAFDRAGLVWEGDAPAAVLLRPGGIDWVSLRSGAWQPSGVPLAAGVDPESLRVVGAFRGELIAVDSAPGELSVVSITRGGASVLGTIATEGFTSAAILEDPGRLVLVTQAEDEQTESETTLPAPGVTRRVISMIEFSLISGRTLESGPATASSPVSRGEFQALAILLFACMVLVLVVVVRPSPVTPEPVLPPGTAIAPPGRRVVASVLDALPALFIASRLLDLSLAETLGPIALPLTGSVDIFPLLLVLGISAGHSAVGEMLTGRSLGKMLTGIFVARVDPIPGVSPEPGRFRPPTPGGAILRSLLKWFLFPATAIILSDPAGRHRGDLISRSAVLMPVADPEQR